MLRFIPWWVYTTTAGLIIGAALYFSVPANADNGASSEVTNYALDAAPAMCSTLDDYPSIPGVQGVLKGIENDSGFNAYQAGQALVIGVESNCPRHMGLLTRFADMYAPQTGGPKV